MDEMRTYPPVGGTESTGTASSGFGSGGFGKARARSLAGAARERGFKAAEHRKGYLASELENLAGTVDQLADSLAERGRGSQQRYVTGAADLMRKTSRTLRERSVDDFLNDAGRQFRQKPGLFLAGCCALGFLGARLLKT